MTKKNKHGLTRTIPADVKREIRKRCGFGCVICGLAFYDYEHFDPDFVDAEEHLAEGMTLLCSQCNQKRARNRLSAETVARANKLPKCLEKGFAHESFDFHTDPIRIQFAGVEFYDCKHLITVNNIPLLSVLPPENEGEPVRLSGIFTDSLGRESLRIEDNEFSVSAGSWDVESEGSVIVFRRKLRDIFLRIKLIPPTGLVVEEIDMLFRGVRLKGNSKELNISFNNVDWATFSAMSLSHCTVGISLNGCVSANDDYGF
ncbi:hypothetical protein [Hafnia psychrotolerans]|uniref:HNH endonuclease n=1 Tax=Hafnia psychrotolerans TaxID=1477018 RepID=A0ABQ1GYV2_9GAMM|nr:hypothetical protein [Hafnia psychrotolerans]GGA53083.1 hypothetical protein GCM10011328_30810 [Hafnia psychrotolerans]